MANNYIIAFALRESAKNYGTVTATIQNISGRWARIAHTVWYIKSDLPGSEIAAKIWADMFSEDSLLVTDATSNTSWWYNLDEKVAAYLSANWHLD